MAQHLLGLEHLTADELSGILDAAKGFVGVGRDVPKRTDLAGKVIANLFYEPSTRTRLSFSLAARRIGAETLDFSPGGSSTAKGESFIDTAQNIVAMGVDAVVVRHSSSGAPHLLTQHLTCHTQRSRAEPPCYTRTLCHNTRTTYRREQRAAHLHRVCRLL